MGATMKHTEIHSSERGSAILLTLGILTIVLVLALVFAMTSRNARTIETAKSDAANAGMVADSAVNRASGTLNHIGTIHNVLPANSATAGTTYPHLPYVGHFFNDTTNAANVPILKAKEIAGNGGSLTQYLFYTHKDANDDQTLYNLLTSTTYGNFLASNCTAFAALANSGADQLQFLPIKDSKAADSHYIARYGYVVLHEGAKFDINQIVKPDSVIPYVDGAEMVNLGGSDSEFAAFETGKSIYPIMGLTDAAKEKVDATTAKPDTSGSDITEDQTLRYGLHPQELRATATSYDTGLALGEAAKPPKWYNYDSLIGLNGTAFADNDDFFLYSVTSGGKDREVRFTGAETDFDDAKPDNRKINLQLPRGVTWDTLNNIFITNDINEQNKFESYLKGGTDNLTAAALSGLASTEAGNYTMPTLLLGAGVSTGLFKADDDTDLTAQVMANLVDFCGNDDKATYVATYKKSSTSTEERLTYSGADTGFTATATFTEPVLCGNIRAPYISGVAISMTPTGEVTSRSEQREYYTDADHTESAKQTVTLWHWGENWTTPPKLQMRMRAVAANLFPDDIAKAAHYKFLVRGKLCIFYRVKPNKKIEEKTGTNSGGATATYYEITDNPTTEFFIGQQYDGSTATTDAVTSIGTLATGDFVSAAAPDNAFFEKNATDFAFTATADAAQPQVGKTFRQDILLTAAADLTLDKEVKQPSNIEGCVNGYGVAFVITDVVVLSSLDSNDAVADLAYFKPHEADKLEDPNVSWKTDAVAVEPDSYDTPGTPDFIAKFDGKIIGGAGGDTDKGALEAMFAVKDPRFNHKTSEWGFCKPVDGTPYSNAVATDCKGNTSVQEFDRIADAKVLADEVVNFSVERFFLTCKIVANDTTNGDKFDWEPELAAEAAAAGSAVDSAAPRKLTNTLSTAIIPNGPITSLWQLGAIHRGEAGRTINLKTFGGKAADHKYATGDAWILDYFKLSELGTADVLDDSDLRTPEAVCGKFNPNCFNEGAYLYFLSYLPKGADANDTAIYLPLASNLTKTIGDQTAAGDFAADLGLKFVDPFSSDDTISKQSWSPVEAFYNFVQVDKDAANINDREAEKFIGCSAGIMSTRYETFTVLAAGQSLRYIMPDSAAVTADFQKTLVNPVKIGTDWYSILGTQLRIVTLVRDCWANRIKVVNVRNL